MMFLIKNGLGFCLCLFKNTVTLSPVVMTCHYHFPQPANSVESLQNVLSEIDWFVYSHALGCPLYSSPFESRRDWCWTTGITESKEKEREDDEFVTTWLRRVLNVWIFQCFKLFSKAFFWIWVSQMPPHVRQPVHQIYEN